MSTVSLGAPGLQQIVLSQISLLPEVSGVIFPLPVTRGENYTAMIVVSVSDRALNGAVVEEQVAVEIADAFSSLTGEEQQGLLYQQFEDGVVKSLRRGDSVTALRTISNIATAQASSGTRGRQLLRAVQEASALMFIDSASVEIVIRALADVTLLRNDFNSTLVLELFTLELELSAKLKVSGNLSPDVGQIFMAALGGILEKEFLDSILLTDFEEGSDASARFVAALSSIFETIKLNVVAAVLFRSVEGEPPILMEFRSVAISVQTVSASAAANAFGPFHGARFQLPSNVGQAVSGGSSMQLILGYSGLVWSGNSSTTTNLTFASGVHSLTLGRIGGGAYFAHNLSEPVLMTYFVNMTAQTKSVYEQRCLFWNIDTAGWDDEGCNLVSANDSDVICACSHLTDFATAFKETAASADFSAFTRLDLFTMANILLNPMPFMLIFVFYFLAAVGVILGSHMETSSKKLQSIRATSMLEVSSFRQIKDQIPAWARILWAVFTVANVILIMLTISVGVIGLATLDSAFNWFFGNVGNGSLLVYALFQLLMVLLGQKVVGLFPGLGLHRVSFLIWLVLGVAFLWTNVYLLQLGQYGYILMPKAFCPAAAAADGAEEEEDALVCRRSWLSFAKIFWESASITNRRRLGLGLGLGWGSARQGTREQRFMILLTRTYLTAGFSRRILNLLTASLRSSLVRVYVTRAYPFLFFMCGSVDGHSFALHRLFFFFVDRSSVFLSLLFLIPIGLPANVKDAESDSLNEECAHELLEVFEDYMSFLGFSHVIILTIVLPTGIFAYIQWVKWRQRSKHLKPIEKVRVSHFCLLDVATRMTPRRIVHFWSTSWKR